MSKRAGFPKEITELENRIDRKLNEGRVSAFKNHKINNKIFKEIIQMGAELDALYDKRKREKSSQKK